MRTRLIDGTEVLIFKYIPEWGINQDITHFIRGKIITSDVVSYPFGNTIIEYIVLGEDNNEYFGNYKTPYGGNSFFLTEEDYIRCLENKINVNKDEQQKLEEQNHEYEQIINSLQNKEDKIVFPCEKLEPRLYVDDDGFVRQRKKEL